MNKTFVLAAAVIVAAQIGAVGIVQAGTAPTEIGRARAGEVVTDDGSGFLSQADTIFAVLDRIEGDQLTLHLLHTVMSRNAQVFMFVGDEVRATLLPLVPGGTRRAACVNEIVGHEGKALLVHRGSDFPRADCLAQVNDFRGAAGLPVDQIVIDRVTTIRLNGDVIMDDPK